jgi:uncharacterized protein YbaR (Trm112 family)
VLPKELLDILCCPKCKGVLELEDEKALICQSCKLRFPIIDEIPVMLIEKAEKID